MLILIVAGDLQNDLAYVRRCHRHFSSMCDIGVVFIAKMFRRSARIAARSLPYEASITNAAGSVEGSTSSDEDEQDSLIQFDSFTFATLPRRNPYSGVVSPRTLFTGWHLFLRSSDAIMGTWWQTAQRPSSIGHLISEIQRKTCSFDGCAGVWTGPLT